MSTNATANSILDSVVNVEPTGVMYNVTNDVIEEFVEKYLDQNGVTGVSAVRVMVLSEGSRDPEVAIYAFVNQKSSGIESSVGSIPPLLRGKVDRVQIRLTDAFKKVLYPIVGSDEIETLKAEGGDYSIRLNIFRVLGMMFSCVPGKHRLIIADAKRLSGNSGVCTVLKSVSYDSRPNDKNDRYLRQINNFERRH